MPDPNIKPVMDEIKAVLAKHDVAGVVFVASKTHTEYLFALSPSWTCIQKEGPFIRIRAKSTDFPSKEAHKQCLSDTIGMIAGLVDAAKKTTHDFSTLLETIGTKLQFSHISRLEPPPEP